MNRPLVAKTDVRSVSMDTTCKTISVSSVTLLDALSVLEPPNALNVPVISCKFKKMAHASATSLMESSLICPWTDMAPARVQMVTGSPNLDVKHAISLFLAAKLAIEPAQIR